MDGFGGGGGGHREFGGGGGFSGGGYGGGGFGGGTEGLHMARGLKLRAQQVIPAEWALTILTLFFVCFRLYIRAVREAVFDASDAIVLFAWILSICSVICDTAAIRLHMWRRRFAYAPHYVSYFRRMRRRETAMKLLFASAFPYYVELWSIKLALLLLYYKTIPKGMKGTRWGLFVTAVTVAVSFGVVMGLTLFWCVPIRLNWSQDRTHDCVAVSGRGYEPFYVITALHLLTDFMLLLIPIPYLRTLTLRRPQKIGIIILYVFGILYIACTVIRTAAVSLHANIPTVGLITSVERAMSIMVVCIPSFKSLLTPRPCNTTTAPNDAEQQPYSNIHNTSVRMDYVVDPQTGMRVRNTSVFSSGWRSWLSPGSATLPGSRGGLSSTTGKRKESSTGKQPATGDSLDVVSRQTSSASRKSNKNRRAVDGWIRNPTRPPSDASDVSGGRVVSGRSEDGADPIAQYKRAYGGRIIADNSNPDQRRSFEYR